MIVKTEHNTSFQQMSVHKMHAPPPHLPQPYPEWSVLFVFFFPPLLPANPNVLRWVSPWPTTAQILCRTETHLDDNSWWWRRWLFGTLLLRHAEIERKGGGQHSELQTPLAEGKKKREVSVGQLVIDGWCLPAWIPEPEASSAPV